MDKYATEQFASLVGQIDQIVEKVSLSQDLRESEIRSVLRFVSQVIQVVEQAFQDVLTLLVEIKYLEPKDIYSGKLMQIQKQVELLTARSHYRDAAEICSRLKYLRGTFDESILPSLQKLPECTGWNGVFGLIEEREGMIINHINYVASTLDSMLSSLTADKLPELRQWSGPTYLRTRGRS
ncbi:hypothetical protein [Burkholderia pseudomallei]|uniref:hypothetical protein n=1 Tax=Burkholderia pseudomallei TaxID=28450 RepID=UPI000A1A12FC|nr:hypothetical protein [Burkholderia pseudomallei]ARL57177.1 hypothetical protein BOC52_11880 [Burkholderia pseudomallei]ARL64155.1 hypothetical protein BOC53_12280 [Burkholderia pseudomallei]